MSTTPGNCDLQLMAKYDFKAPIKSTVIIYDSDEDDKPSIEQEKCSNDVPKNIDNIFDSFEYQCETTNRTNHETENSSIKRKTPSELNGAKRMKIAENYTRDSNTELVSQNQADVLSMAQTANNTACNQTIPTEDQNSNINQIAITTSQASSERHPLVSTPQTSQNEDLLNKTANKCLETLLDTVSTHMIFITQAYADYAAIARTTTNRDVLQMARNHYQNAKYHFFYLSFSAVSNILLPKQNDKAFMENFIAKTIKLAHSKHILIIKYSDMAILCAEMLNWTKSHIKNPVLSALLTKEPQPTVLTSNTNYYQKQSNKETYSSENTCIFRSGPVDRELIINVNSAAIQNSQNNMPQIHNTHVPCACTLCLDPSIQSALPTTPAVELRNNANSRNNIQEFQSQFLNTIYEPNRGSKTKRKQPKTIHHPATPPQTSRPPPYYSTNTYHYETVMPQIQSKNQITNPVNYNSTSVHQVHQAQEEGRRSLSRDSGFTSLASNDQMCSSPGHEHIDASLVTPMITHVTSLNPSVAFIKDGICYVCGKLTKQKCLGCYKFYYCSNICQIADWKHHAFICK